MNSRTKKNSRCGRTRIRHGWKGQLICWVCGAKREKPTPVLHPKNLPGTITSPAQQKGPIK